ncbi:MAG: tetratricopeptide repeat protein [Cyclobacteriaceae bacterium]
MLAKVLSAVVAFILLFTASGQSAETGRVNELLENEKYQEAIELSDSLLSLSELRDKFHFLHSKKGDAYYFLGESKRSLESYLRALDEVASGNFEDRKQLQETQSYTGFTYNELGLHDKAIKHYRQSLALAIELGDSVEVAVGHFNISNSLLRQGHLDDAMTHLLSAYEIDKIRKDTSAIGFDLNALGFAQLQFGNVQEAIKYYRESIALLAKSSGNFNSLGTRYNNLSMAFNQGTQYDSAIHYNNLSIEVHSQFNDSINLAERWINRAKILSAKNSTRQALDWARKAKGFFEKFERGQSILAANEVLIECLDALGRYSQALDLCAQNISMSKSLNQVSLHRNTLLQQASLFEKTGNTSKAYQAHKAAILLSDSIQSIESRRLTEQLEIKYEVDKIESENSLLKLEQEIAQAEIDKKNVRLQWLILLIGVITISAILITFVILSRGKIKSKLLETEVSELRLQIKGLIDYKPEESSISIGQLNDVLKEPLSEREFEILQLAMGEQNNGQIADNIFVSVNTVKYHLKNIYSKLGVSNRREALKFAFQNISN